MAEGYTEAIQKAFDVALKSFADANSMAVQFENGQLMLNGSPVTMSTSQPYLAGYCLPAGVDSADLYFTDQRVGIYQIDINYASTTGSASLNRMTDKLNAAFKAGECLSRSPVSVEITRFSHERVNIANGWATKSITLEWITHTARL